MKFFKSKINSMRGAIRKFFGFGFDILSHLRVSNGHPISGRAIYDKLYWLKKYDECEILQVPVRALEDGFSKVAWKLKRKEFRREGPPVFREVFDHPFLDLMKRPNPDLTGRAFKKMMVRHWELTGEIIVFIEERNRLGEPTKIFLVEPYKLTSIPDENEAREFVFSIGQGVHEKQIHSPESSKDVVYIRDPAGWSCHGRGVGKATAITREVLIDEKSSDWSLALFTNGSNPGTIVHMPDVEEEDLEKLQEKWDNDHTGVQNVGRTLFLSSDSLEGKSPLAVERMGGTHKELDYNDSKESLFSRSLRNWKTPRQIIGDIQGGSRSDTGGADFIYQSNNVKPLVELLAEEFEMRLLSQFRGSKNLVISFEDPVKEEAAFRHKRLIEGAKFGLAAADEWRADADLEPMAGILGSAHSLPMNMTWVTPDGQVLIEGNNNARTPREEDDADNAASSVALNAANRALEQLKGLTFEHPDE